MRVRLTCLSAGEFFELDGNLYKKLEDREHGRNVQDEDGRITKFPLMALVNKVAEPEKKKKRVRKPKDEPLVDYPNIETDDLNSTNEYGQ